MRPLALPTYIILQIIIKDYHVAVINIDDATYKPFGQLSPSV